MFAAAAAIAAAATTLASEWLELTSVCTFELGDIEPGDRMGCLERVEIVVEDWMPADALMAIAAWLASEDAEKGLLEYSPACWPMPIWPSGELATVVVVVVVTVAASWTLDTRTPPLP